MWANKDDVEKNNWEKPQTTSRQPPGREEVIQIRKICDLDRERPRDM
ncbi:hypothetical protein EUX98_g1169 [Antrodiella citrinella]|uniref:Uncharacterized protein n=1 Tax=Antrodiella citrinella TaxID=2447956 RepID=A0A4S4N4J6_9APHY|nr:hypothetical protein EUX98_g1169 [Antrodiella citrinella]